jgi:hypothetical protein
MPFLSSPYSLKGITRGKHIGVFPMCQYMAKDGYLNDRHYRHATTDCR